MASTISIEPLEEDFTDQTNFQVPEKIPKKMEEDGRATLQPQEEGVKDNTP